MLLKIKNLLSAEECARLVALAGELKFVDGRVSNPANTSKQNLQADPSDPKYAESVTIVGNAMTRSREFGSFAIPKRIAPPLLCRYEPGMKYGSHADAAIIQLPNTKIRSDLSCTVFIGDPAAYEGGELAMVLGNQTLAFKGAPGEAIVYPSTLLHEVVPVRSGQRLVSITFIESRETSGTTLGAIPSRCDDATKPAGPSSSTSDLARASSASSTSTPVSEGMRVGEWKGLANWYRPRCARCSRRTAGD